MSSAVKANPGLYFGAFPAADWPLVIAAWTAADLLRLAPAAPVVDVILHRGGPLSATVRGATVAAPPHEARRPVADIIRSGLWYTELSRSTTVHTTSDHPSPLPGEADRVWSGLTVTVHSELDANLFGLPDGTWWRDGIARFAKILATPRHRPPDGRRVHVTDERTGERASLP
ncbi:hypothetical protein ACQP1P_29235 [Dactylosporangium sp. CA-052675]|uniref:hypothetical protein n=1 Tax=Dactylosporangium sp. CA-052675 TaxID=3239927 RepID=UPI003D8E769B